MAKIKSTISNFTSNKVGGLLDKGIDLISGISKYEKFGLGDNNIKTVYPIDLLSNDQYGEMIKFSMLEMPIDAKSSAEAPSTDPNKSVEKNSSSDLKSSAEAVKINDYKAGTPTKKADIYMYVPAQSMVNANQIDWETKESSALINSDGSAREILEIAKGSITGAAAGLLGKIGESKLKQSQIAINSNIESFFTGVGLRKFSFAFEFAPRSEAELRNALIICNTFKKYSLPTKTSQNIFKYPMAWKFAIHSAKNGDNGKQLALMGSDRCYITATTLNMSPDSVWTTFYSGHPVIFNLNVSFVEDEIMDRTKYNDAEYEL